jgi:eukaryotic-like serine/threonine-protein kinase
MGVVYRAEHVTTHRAVAVKTVRAASEGQLHGIRREIRALAKIDHRGVVRILDEGVEGGVPWYAMELLVGRTLRQQRRSDSVPIFRRRASIAAGELIDQLTIFRALCAPLAYVHGEGIVHCDLKPDNVFLAGGRRPVLVDFGLTSRFGVALSREVLDVEPFMGTAEYMAPEQWERSPVDARTDLYALGCMLFEAITGTPPWVGNRPELSRAHTSEGAPRASERTAGVPSELDQLLLGLLAKKPRDRIGHAEEVARVLGGLGAADPEEDRPHRPYLFLPAMSGRDSTVGAVIELLSGGEDGRFVLVGGESGVGKTKLAVEMARRAKRNQVRVITAECAPISEAHALSNLLLAIADRCRAFPDSKAALIGGRARVLSRLEPSLSEQVEAEPDAPLDPEMERDRLLDALLLTIQAFVKEAPTFILLDDLQWADEITLELVKRLAEHKKSLPALAFLGTYRSEEIGVGLESLLDASGVEKVSLERLDERAVERMVSDMLGFAAPAEFVGFLAAQSEGNPFFVGEYLRAALGEGILVRTSSGRWNVKSERRDLGLPGSVFDLVAHRIASLSDEARRLLEAAAVLGRESDPEVAGRVAKLDVTAAEDAIEELLKRQIVEESTAGRIRLSHDKIREVAYERLPQERSIELHGRAADELAAQGAPSSVLAHHYERADRPLEAIDHLEAAAKYALSTGAQRRAAEMLERALSLAEGRDLGSLRRARWYRMLGESRLAGGDLSRSMHAAHAALDVLRFERPTSRSEWWLALVGELLRQAFHRVVPEGWIVDRGQSEALIEATLASGMLSRIAFFENDPLRLVAAAFWSVNLAERAGKLVQAARNYSGLGWIFGTARLRKLADAYFARARRTAEETRDGSGLIFALTSEAIYRTGLGQWARVEEGLTQARRACEQTQNKHDLELVETLAGHPAYFQGRFEEAIARHEAVLASAERRGNRQHQAWSLYCIARNLLCLGEAERAVELLEDAGTLLAEQTDQLSDIATYGLLASACARAGRIDAAVEAARFAEARAKDVPPTVFLSLHGYEGAVEARIAMMRRDPSAECRAELDHALDRLSRFAGAFPIGRPSLALWRGRAAAALGKGSRAEKHLASAAESATSLGMTWYRENAQR